MNEPKYETRNGGVLVLTWDADTFAGVPISEINEHDAFEAHEVSEPGKNLAPINAWWAENKNRVIAHLSEGVIEHSHAGTVKY